LKCTVRELEKAENDTKSWIEVYKRVVNDRVK